MIFGAMAAVFGAGVVALRLPVGISIALGALAGALLGGMAAHPAELLRQITEGEMAYFDPTLYILSATIFMVAIERSGLLGTVARGLLVAFHRSPVLLLTAITVLVIFPGMMTGSSTAAVLSTGALVSPVLMKLGIPREKAGAIITMIAICGLAAPPVNIPALIICAGADIPYLGFGLPLFALSFPIALFSTLWLGLRHARGVRLQDIESSLPESHHARFGWRLYLPLVILAALLTGEHVAPQFVGHLGLPLVFLLAAASALVTGLRASPWAVTQEALRRSLGILAILMGVGMFIQIMTHTGARGAIAVSCAALPRELLYPIMGLSLPLFGAISSYGAASVLGVPFVLSMLTHNAIILVSALSLLACLGDLTPPTAKAGLFAAAVVGEKNYLRIVRHCVVPAIVTIAAGLCAVIFANDLKFLVGNIAVDYLEGNGHAGIEAAALQRAAAGEAEMGLLLRAVPMIYQAIVGLFALSVLVFLWRDTGRLTKFNGLLVLVPLLLRFLHVV